MDTPAGDPKPSNSDTTSLNFSQPIPTYSACAASKGHVKQRRCRSNGLFIKIIKAFCIATLMLVWVLIGKRYASHVRHRLYRNWAEGGRPEPRDGNVVKCVNGADWTSEGAIYTKDASSPKFSTKPPSYKDDPPHTAKTSFHLPVNSDVLYLLSRGSLQPSLVLGYNLVL